MFVYNEFTSAKVSYFTIENEFLTINLTTPVAYTYQFHYTFEDWGLRIDHFGLT